MGEREYEIGDQHRPSTLMIKKDGDKLTGAMDWTDQKDEKTQGREKAEGGDTSTFSAERKFGVSTSPSSTSSRLPGTSSRAAPCDNDGQKTEFDITGAREKKGK